MTEPTEAAYNALEVAESRVYRTVYRRQRDIDRHPDIDPARLPVTVYSSSQNLDFQREDLAYLRSEGEGHDGVAEAWVDTRIEYQWERTDD